MTIYYIYETVNIINGKKYRGAHQSNTENDSYLGSGKALLNAIKKYGRSNFIKTILEFANSKKEMYELEKKYVNEEWVSDSKTYNIKLGGVGGWDHTDNEYRIKKLREYFDSIAPKILLKCIECDNTFFIKGKNPKKLCSKSCAAIHNNKKRSVEPNTICAECNIPVRKPPSDLKYYPRHFCSKSHAASWYVKNRKNQ